MTRSRISGFWRPHGKRARGEFDLAKHYLQDLARLTGTSDGSERPTIEVDCISRYEYNASRSIETTTWPSKMLFPRREEEIDFCKTTFRTLLWSTLNTIDTSPGEFSGWNYIGE